MPPVSVNLRIKAGPAMKPLPATSETILAATETHVQLKELLITLDCDRYASAWLWLHADGALCINQQAMYRPHLETEQEVVELFLERWKERAKQLGFEVA